MNGYVINITKIWINALKRSVAPGSKISLDELYLQYGEKHGLREGTDFVEWLQNVKLKDREKWKVVMFDNESTEESLTVEDAQASKENKKTETRQTVLNNKHMPTNVAPMVQSKLTVADLVGMSVRQAREAVPSISDLNLLKYALQEANQLTGKDSLCMVIRKRIKEMQLSR